MFEIDSPISNESQDRYSRVKIARQLGKALGTWQDKDGALVVAVYGPWGSGKTSLKNLTLNFLDEGFKVKEFNPWMCKGVEQITEQFFETLISAIDSQEENDRKQIILKKDAKREMKRFSTRLKPLTELVNLSRNIGRFWILALPAIVAAFPEHKEQLLSLSMVANFAHSHEKVEKDPVFGKEGLSESAAQTLESATELFESWSKSDSDDEGAEHNLVDVYNRLKGLLKNLPNKMLVVLDDIDRLSPEEIRALFQMIKANSDFPNLVFLILCDRSYVQHCLADVLPKELNNAEPCGQNFLDKIVHCGVPVPVYGPDLIRKDSHRFYEFMAKYDGEFSRQQFDKSLEMVAPYLRTPRNFIRFKTAVKFQAVLLTSETGPVLDFEDLLLVEALRIFEPSLHEQIGAHQSAIFSNQATTALNSLEGFVRNERKDTIRKVLQKLFPIYDQRVFNKRTERKLYCLPVFERYYFGMDESTRFGD